MKRKSSEKRSKVKFGVIGLGHIAQSAVLPAFLHAKKDVELAALISGDAKKLKVLAKKYKVASTYSYEEFDQCLESGIDALYIALPNALHAAYAVRALKKGVHVLCEKPLAVTEEECQKIIQAAKSSGAKLMTAYRLHFDEANLKAVELAKTKIGDPRFFSSNFSYQIQDRKNIRLREEEGGPLWDIGIYCLNAARYVFRDEPTEVMAMATKNTDARFTEVPESVAVLLRFPGERLASFNVSFGSEATASFSVVGSKGKILLENAYEYVEKRELELKVGEKTKKFSFKKVDQFAPELIYFADCIRNNRNPEPSGAEGLADVRALLAIEESIQKKKMVSLGRIPRSIAEKKRPTIKLMMRRPPVKKPVTIHTTSPSGG